MGAQLQCITNMFGFVMQATLADCKIADEKHDRTVVDSRDALLCTMDKLLGQSPLLHSSRDEQPYFYYMAHSIQ